MMSAASGNSAIASIVGHGHHHTSQARQIRRGSRSPPRVYPEGSGPLGVRSGVCINRKARTMSRSESPSGRVALSSVTLESTFLSVRDPMEEQVVRAKWMIKHGVRPNHVWKTPMDQNAVARGILNPDLCMKCSWDSPFKAFRWAHPIIIQGL